MGGHPAGLFHGERPVLKLMYAALIRGAAAASSSASSLIILDDADLDLAVANTACGVYSDMNCFNLRPDFGPQLAAALFAIGLVITLNRRAIGLATPSRLARPRRRDPDQGEPRSCSSIFATASVRCAAR
jgi:hypothetical protein